MQGMLNHIEFFGSIFLILIAYNFIDLLMVLVVLVV